MDICRAAPRILDADRRLALANGGDVRGVAGLRIRRLLLPT